MRGVKGILALALIGMVGLAPTAHAQETLAASCGPGTVQNTISTDPGTPGLAQTFTSALTGTLNRTEVQIFEDEGGLGDYLVQIRTVGTDGAPTGVILATATISDAAVPLGHTPINVAFANPATVVNGQAYAIALLRPEKVGWSGTENCPGASWFTSNGGQTWHLWFPDVDPDFVFRAFVTPAICKGEQATHIGTEGDDEIIGTEGPDVIAPLGGNDQVTSLGGDDLVCGGAGNDGLRGGTNKDKLIGQAGKDTLRGQKGKDKLLGKGGKDKLNGGTGKDVCKGGKKDDSAKKCEVEKSI